MNAPDPKRPPEPEAVARHALRRAKALAGGLLAVNLALFGATWAVAEPGFWGLLLRAGTEAALVGGLADWFAVVALFRRPLGLPLRHTAIIPRNRDRIGEGLGRFVERHFLDGALVAARLRKLDPARRFGAWLADPLHARMLGARLAAVIPYALESAGEGEIRAFLRRALTDELRRADLAPLLGQGVDLLAEAGHHHAAFDRMLALAADMLAENEERLFAAVRERSAWWIPRKIDERVARAIVEGVREHLAALSDPGHAVRQRFDQAVAQLAQDLRHNPDYAARVRSLRDQLLAHPRVQDSLGLVWDRLRARLVDRAGDPESSLRRALDGALAALGAALATDAMMQTRLNRRIEALMLRYVVPFRAEIGRFIADVVKGWDANTVSERLELALGRDLQYIRINGTVVGALVGCLIFLATRLLGG